MTHKIATQKQKVLDYLISKKEDQPASLIAEGVGMNYYVCYARLENLEQDGKIERVKNNLSYTWRIKK